MFKHLKLIIVTVALVPSVILAVAPDVMLWSIRQQGMGGAQVAVVKDDSALFINPAGLSNLEGFHLKFPRIRAELSTAWIEKGAKFSEISSSGDENAQLGLLKELVPFQGGINLGLAPAMSVSMPGFGIGLFVGGRITPQLVRQTNPTLELTGSLDAVSSIGISEEFGLLGLPLNVGLVGKYIIRNQIYNTTTGSDLFKLDSGGLIKNINSTTGWQDTPDMYQMSGFGFDLGILTTINEEESLHVGFVLRNLMTKLEGEQTLITGAKSVSEELPLIGTLGLGYRTQMDFLGGLLGDLDVALDYQVMSPETEVFKNLFVGFEQGILFDIIKLRGGLKQGYVVGGFGIDLFLLHVNYAWDVVDIGTSISEGLQIDYHSLEIGLLF